MPVTSYEIFIAREILFEVLDLTSFDKILTPDTLREREQYVRRLQRSEVQSGEEGYFQGMIDSIIGKISHFKSMKDEETRRITDLVLNTFEAIPLAVQDIASATCSTQVIGACLRAFKMFTRSSVISTVVSTSSWIFEKLQAFSQEYHAQEVESVLQSGEFEWVISGARTILSGYKDIKNSLVVRKFYDLIQYFLSFGLFQSFGLSYENLNFSSYEAHRKRQEYHSIEGFCFNVLETTVWMLERGMQCLKTKSFQPFFHCSETYAKWAHESHRLLEDAVKIVSAPALRCENENVHTPAEKAECVDCKRFGNLDEHDFLARLEKAIDNGESMEKYAENATEKSTIGKMLRELRITQARFLSKDRAQRTRRPPFTLLVHGTPKVAKTMFMDICFMHYAKVHKKDPNPECLWTRQSMDKFYSGYKPWKWCIRIDDIAMYSPKATPLDPSIADVIMLNNGVPFIAPMASVEEKGIYAVRPDFVIASTNTADLNASAYFSCPLAVRRRFPYIVDLKIKPEFLQDGSDMIDPAKIKIAPGEYQNTWFISLKKLKVFQEENQVPQIGFEEIAEFEDIDDFLAAFSALSIAHVTSEDKCQVSAEAMRTIEICDQCYRSKSKCKCALIQSGSVTSSANSQDSDIESVLSNDMRDYMSDEECERLRNFLRKMRLNFLAQVHDSEIISISDAETELYPTYSDDVSDEELEDRRTWFTKALDWVDDELEIITTIAKSMAMGVQAAVWKVSDSILSAASDLMVLYQVKKFKRIVSEAGQRMYDSFVVRSIAGFCALALAGWGIWKALAHVSKLFLSPGDVQSEGVVPSFMARDEKPNPWVKDEIILSEFQVPSKSRGWAQLDSTAVQNLIKPNVAAFKMEYEDGSGIHHIPGTAMCVAGHVYMTNNHCIPESEAIMCYLAQEPATGNIGKNVKFALSPSMIYRIPERDIAFFWCMLPPKMDATELFMKKSTRGMVCNGFYVHCRYGQKPEVNSVKAIRESPMQVPLAQPMTLNCHVGTPQDLTQHGDCGSPLIGMTPLGPVILGIHQQLFRGTHQTGANQVLQSDIENAISFFGTQVQCGIPNLRDKLGSLNHKSVLHWPNEGQAHVYGSAPRAAWRSVPKSRVQDTYISEAAQAEGFVKRCGPPVMKGPEVWHKNIEPTVTQTCLFDKGILDECIDAFVEDILKGLTPADLAEIVKLDDKTTMNGYPGVKFLDKINRQTSMGYPYRKSKTQYLVPLEDDDVYTDAVEYTPEIMEEVRLIRETYDRGERYMPVFVMSLKDEPVPFKKIEIKKTRGFMGGPAAWQFVYRQHLLTFVRCFQLHPELFEGAPGMNVNSCSWKHLHDYLTRFGLDQIVAGDYEKFDKRMSPMFILAAFQVIIGVLRAAGRSERDIIAVLCMANDVAYPLTDVQGDFIEFFGSNPSGHALTVIINCLVNSLYMRYVYRSLNPLKRVDTFKEFVALMTYGDDNAMGVSKQTPWFNHTTISQLLAKYDVVYTMADKTSESKPYIHISEASFLKRRFVDVDGRMSCPLEWASIDKMLTSCVASKSVCPEEQAAQSIRSAVGEFFMYGRETFETNVKKMRRIVAATGLEPFVQKSTFPTYDMLEESFREASRGCSRCVAFAA